MINRRSLFGHLVGAGSLDMAGLLAAVADTLSGGLSWALARQMANLATCGMVSFTEVLSKQMTTHSCSTFDPGCSRGSCGRIRHKCSKSGRQHRRRRRSRHVHRRSSGRRRIHHRSRQPRGSCGRYGRPCRTRNWISTCLLLIVRLNSPCSTPVRRRSCHRILHVRRRHR